MSEIDERVTPTPRGIVIVASEPEYKDDDNDTLMDHLQAMSFNHNHVETLFEMPEALDVRAELTVRLTKPTVTREQIRAAVYNAGCKHDENFWTLWTDTPQSSIDMWLDAITDAVMAVIAPGTEGGE